MLAIVAASLVSLAGSQALCSLRDPRAQIFALFPEADSYRSIVGVVGKTARKAVSDRLPFDLHFNELGRHTLYVPQKDGAPLGLVHARSEAGNWGLVEVVWGFDLDMNVVGMEFQRCRDRSKRSLDGDAGKAALIGRDFSQLREYLDPKGESLRDGALGLPGSARPLGALVVRNALKTVAVTESVWGSDIWELRAKAFALTAEPDVEGVVMARFEDGARAGSRLEQVALEVGVKVNTVGVWRCSDAKGLPLGSVVRVPWSIEDQQGGEPIVHRVDLFWWIDTSGQIKRVTPRSGWENHQVRSAFDGTVGLSLASEESCAGATELVALVALRADAAAVPAPARARRSD